MGEPKLINVARELPYPKLIFNRPINPIAYPKIAIIGGSVGHLQQLNLSYEASNILKTLPTLFISAQLKDSTGPAMAQINHEVIESNLSFESSPLQGINANYSSALIGVDLALTSYYQIMLEKFMLQSDLPIIATDDTIKIFESSPQLRNKENIIFILSSVALISYINKLKIRVKTSSARGILQIHDYATSLLDTHPALKLIVYSSEHAVCFDAQSPDQLSFIQSNKDIYKLRGLLYGITAAMVSWPLRTHSNFFENASNGLFFFYQTISDSDNQMQSLSNMYNQAIE